MKLSGGLWANVLPVVNGSCQESILAKVSRLYPDHDSQGPP